MLRLGHGMTLVAILCRSSLTTSNEHHLEIGAEEPNDETTFIQASAFSKQMEVKSERSKNTEEQAMKNTMATCTCNGDDQHLGEDASCKSLSDGEMLEMLTKTSKGVELMRTALASQPESETIGESHAAEEQDLNAIDGAYSAFASFFSSYLEVISCFILAVLVRHFYAKQRERCGSTAKHNAEINVAESRSNLNPHAKDAWGCTALHDAAKVGSAATVKKLTESGFKVDAVDAWDETPLHMAAREGHIEVCNELLTRGAAIDAINAQDWTPLVVAADAGQEAMCSWLLARGASKAHLPRDELPPLLRAIIAREEVHVDGAQ